MIASRHGLFPLAAILLLVALAPAQEPIRFARTPDISPDGKLVAFSYLGDLWTVEAIGGVARPVTMHAAHDAYPTFSPDGRSLAFSSNRHGSYDVFVVATHGGKPRRLTADSANDIVCGWAPDGKSILFASTRGNDFPPRFELFSVPTEGGRATQVTRHEGKEGVYAPKGDQIAYTRGPGTWYRKGYRGSSNDEVWVCGADGSNHRRLTTFNGQDTSPMWAPDGQTVYYVSEFHGTPANIVRQPVASGSPQQLTHHKDDGVRRARLSGNGDWIVYECGADLWVCSARDGTSRKLAIEVHADDKDNTEVTRTFTQGCTEFALSPDEKHVAFVVHGDLFLMPASGPPSVLPFGPSSSSREPAGTKVTRLTDHPAFDHGIAWAPDGSKLLFASDRGGHEDLYLLEPDDPEDPKKTLVQASRFKTTQLTSTPAGEAGYGFSPDGKRISYLRNGNLWTMAPDGKDPKVLVSEVQIIDYEWSPDSKWLVYSRLDGSFACELYIVPAAGGAAKNVTRHATWNAGVTWSGNGKKLAFISERRGTPGVYVLSLQRPAAPDAPASSDIDWEDIHLRVEQPAPIPAQEAAISSDGSKVAFRSAYSNADDLWIATADGKSVTRVTNGSLRPTQLHWSRRHSDTVYFRDRDGRIRTARNGVGEPGTMNFRVKMTVRREEEFTEMFEQSWRYLAENFYDPKYHGADWEAVRRKYRPAVKHIGQKEDLYTLISLMLGELNASHLGVYGFVAPPEETTADLGLLFDEAYRGPGLKVTEILKRGPADKRGLNLKAGDILLAVDGTELTEKLEVSRALNDKVDQNVTLLVTSNAADPKAKRKVEMQAVGRAKVQALMYDRWVERNAKRVAELSQGKMGYIHIPSMDEDGLDRFVRALYSDTSDKEAIVLDVRFNGGGFTHDQVLNYLGAREHTYFRHRDGGEGPVLRAHDRKWSKPLVLLINNRSFSDAEIFPSAFRMLGLGKLVGEPTGGHVIGTSSLRLIDGSTLRIPRLGVFTAKGVNMEKEGVAPDHLVEVHPDQLAKGLDPQLDKAVEVLRQDVLAWKKAHAPVAQATETKPAVAVPMPMAKP